MRVPRSPNRRSRKPLAALAGGALTLSMVAAGAATTAASAAPARPAAAASTASSCNLGGGTTKHVIYLQFDNTHYTRDNPNVPSDLQQMPNLLHFITGNGTLISHEHTPLIAHTANDSVTSSSGLYGDRQGMPIANTYQYYTGAKDGSTDTAGSFAYWTDPIVDYSTGAPVHDKTTTMVGPSGKTPPAPWVSYTRAGCNFGSVAAANTELENTTPDVPLVFGAKSPDAKEAENPSNAGQALAAADYMGLSVHCAKGSAVCTRHHSVPDRLTQEPGGYNGYRALYGAKYIDPLLNPTSKQHEVKNLNGQVIKDSSGNIGFPGYNGMTGTNALAYTLDMQTHGVPVTYTYLTDLHDSLATGAGLGPGTSTYEAQLKAENAAFGTFFTDLAKHGITKANTLFVISSDEGDHFVGGAPSPANCNGVKVACTYKNVGEVDGNLTGMLAAKGITTPFDVAADSAPIVYVHGQPSRANTSVRALERTAATLTANDLATGKTVKLTNYLADPVEMKLLHMITGDPKRTATLALFGNPDFWLDSSLPPSCATTVLVCQPSGGDAWNHGDVAPEINTTWLGLVGPGVQHQGVNNWLWSDHTNIQPTMMALLKLHDDYTPDGRVLAEVIKPSTLPKAMRTHGALLIKLGDVYSQINAAVGAFGLDTLKASTKALASASSGDATYKNIENQLIKLGNERDAIVSLMKAELYGAAFGGHPLNVKEAKGLIEAANGLLAQAAALA